jgi:hypothetical protein
VLSCQKAKMARHEQQRKESVYFYQIKTKLAVKAAQDPENCEKLLFINSH